MLLVAMLAMVLMFASAALAKQHGGTATATAAAAAAAQYQYAAASPTATATALPVTGGSPTSLIALGAGALLVAGGLVARRIIR